MSKVPSLNLAYIPDLATDGNSLDDGPSFAEYLKQRANVRCSMWLNSLGSVDEVVVERSEIADCVRSADSTIQEIDELQKEIKSASLLPQARNERIKRPVKKKPVAILEEEEPTEAEISIVPKRKTKTLPRRLSGNWRRRKQGASESSKFAIDVQKRKQTLEEEFESQSRLKWEDYEMKCDAATKRREWYLWLRPYHKLLSVDWAVFVGIALRQRILSDALSSMRSHALRERRKMLAMARLKSRLYPLVLFKRQMRIRSTLKVRVWLRIVAGILRKRRAVSTIVRFLSDKNECTGMCVAIQLFLRKIGTCQSIVRRFLARLRAQRVVLMRQFESFQEAFRLGIARKKWELVCTDHPHAKDLQRTESRGYAVLERAMSGDRFRRLLDSIHAVPQSSVRDAVALHLMRRRSVYLELLDAFAAEKRRVEDENLLLKVRSQLHAYALGHSSGDFPIVRAPKRPFVPLLFTKSALEELYNSNVTVDES